MDLRLSTSAGPLTLTAVCMVRPDGTIIFNRLEITNPMAESASMKAFKDAVEANFASIRTGITNLDTTIQNFQPTGLSTEDQADLDQIQADSASLATLANQSPAVPPVPAT